MVVVVVWTCARWSHENKNARALLEDEIRTHIADECADLLQHLRLPDEVAVQIAIAGLTRTPARIPTGRRGRPASLEGTG